MIWYGQHFLLKSNLRCAILIYVDMDVLMDQPLNNEKLVKWVIIEYKSNCEYFFSSLFNKF